MKRLVWGLVLISFPLMAELSMQRIDKMVSQIQGKRVSRVKVDFQKIASPFAVMVQQDVNATPILVKPERQVELNLSAIVNDRACINGRWLGVGETIEGYRVEKVEENHVVLRKGKRTMELFLPNPDHNKLLQISEG
jgi:hypothetical protein